MTKTLEEKEDEFQTFLEATGCEDISCLEAADARYLTDMGPQMEANEMNAIDGVVLQGFPVDLIQEGPRMSPRSSSIQPNVTSSPPPSIFPQVIITLRYRFCSAPTGMKHLCREYPPDSVSYETNGSQRVSKSNRLKSSHAFAQIHHV
jgi:hypothetical protein